MHASTARSRPLRSVCRVSPDCWSDWRRRSMRAGGRSATDPPTARIQVVSDGYFDALAIPLVAGRAFGNRDGRDTVPVAIVNRAFAQRYFPNGDAVGRTIAHQLSIVPGEPTRRVIVGIAGNV